MTNGFEVEAPPPFYNFSQWKQSEQNKALELFNPSGDVRKVLNKEQLEKFQTWLDKLTRYLAHHGMDELLFQFDALKQAWAGLVTERYELMKQHEDKADVTDAYHALKSRAQDLKAQRKQLLEAMRPHRKFIRLKQRIEQRITEHEIALKDETIERKNRRLMELEANSVAEIIVRAANASDYCFRTTYKGRERIDRIRFKRVIVTPDTIQIQIDAARRGLFGSFRWNVPRGVNIPAMLKDEDFLAQCSGAIGMPVTSPQVNSGMWQQGYWFFVQRNGLVDGVREHVRYVDYIQRYPTAQRERLPFPIGLREGNWVGWAELSRQPHAIITGQTGSGKTNAMLSIISTLIANNSPGEVQFIFADLKEGVDFGMFKDIPHCVMFIEDIPTLSKAVAKLEAIRAERMIELKKAGVRNINEYNNRHPDYRMPHLLCIVDEFGAIGARQFADQARVIYDACAQIAMKGRASGIHLLIGAQTPRKEHVPADVRDNITLRLSGRQQSVYASISATGSGAAANLPKIAGRFWLEDGADGYPVQMPEILDSEIDEAIDIANTFERVKLIDLGIDEAVAVGAVVVKDVFNTEKFIDVVLAQLDGTINYRAVFEHVRDTMPQYNLSLSQAKRIADGLKGVATVEHRGMMYEIVSAGRGTGKKIQAIKDHDISYTPEPSVIDDMNVNEELTPDGLTAHGGDV